MTPFPPHRSRREEQDTHTFLSSHPAEFKWPRKDRSEPRQDHSGLVLGTGQSPGPSSLGVSSPGLHPTGLETRFRLVCGQHRETKHGLPGAPCPSPAPGNMFKSKSTSPESVRTGALQGQHRGPASCGLPAAARLVPWEDRPPWEQRPPWEHRTPWEQRRGCRPVLRVSFPRSRHRPESSLGRSWDSWPGGRTALTGGLAAAGLTGVFPQPQGCVLTPTASQGFQQQAPRTSTAPGTSTPFRGNVLLAPSRGHPKGRVPQTVAAQGRPGPTPCL